MALRQLQWRHTRPAAKKVAPTKAAQRPTKRKPAVSLEDAIGELEACVKEVGRGRMGPVQRKTGYVIVALRAADDQLYYLRIATRNYIVKPPSCTFVDAKGRQRAAAWPEYDREGPFRPPIFICTPPTAEFYKYHDDHAYDPKTGTLVNTVCTIFTSLNDAAYCGRFAPPDGRMSDHLRLRLQRRFR